MASRTICGFWVVAALSRYTSGLPWTRWFRTGKFWRWPPADGPAGCSVKATLVATAMEFLQQQLLQLLAQRLDLDTVHDVARKRVESADCGRRPFQCRAIADKRCLPASNWPMVAPCVQRTSSAWICSSGLVLMTAFFGKHQILVGLLGVGLLRVFADQDLAVEDRAGLAVQNALVKLVAGGVGLGVIDGGVIVDVLLAVRPDKVR